MMNAHPPLEPAAKFGKALFFSVAAQRHNVEPVGIGGLDGGGVGALYTEVPRHLREKARLPVCDCPKGLPFPVFLFARIEVV